VNVEQREAWRRAEDHTWRAMYVVVINLAFLGAMGIFALMAGRLTMRQLALGAPGILLYGVLAWGVGQRQSRIAAAVLVALAAVPFGAQVHRHAWGGAMISAVFLGIYALAFYGAIVLHHLRALDGTEARKVKVNAPGV
jgi:hypothetical protein